MKIKLQRKNNETEHRKNELVPKDRSGRKCIYYRYCRSCDDRFSLPSNKDVKALGYPSLIPSKLTTHVVSEWLN